MNYSLLYTSRRPHCIAATISRWIDTASEKHNVEVILTADEDDRDTATAMLAQAKMWSAIPVAVKGPFSSSLPGSASKGWNLAAEKSSGRVLIAISDDFTPPNNWDMLLSRVSHPGWQNVDAAVLVGDGIPRENLVLTLPIITRKRYGRLGYMYHPAYPSMWNDNEAAQHAANDGALICATHLIFRHEHFINGKRREDAVDRGHSSKWHYEQGRRVFEARQALGFPIDAGPRALPPRVDVFNPIAYILTSGDDFAIQEVCWRLFDEGVRSFFFSIPDTLWNGEPVHSGMNEVAAMIHAMAAIGATVYRQDICVEKYAGAALLTDMEGRARNAALREISELGFSHVLIVDDDELWPRGLLAQVKSVVERDNPPYIHAACIPVVGAPGLPVQGAKDLVGIYINANQNRFLAGRSPYRAMATITDKKIIHFTACRKTPQEIADKMRSSAHYGDPDYDFEHWIRRVLHNAHPGMRRVHMYVKGENVWPELRNWTEEELDEIPPNLRQYLWQK